MNMKDGLKKRYEDEYLEYVRHFKGAIKKLTFEEWRHRFARKLRGDKNGD